MKIKYMPNVIDEFLKGTPIWVRNMRTMNKVAHTDMCPMCGCNPDKMEELAKAVEELKEKAWKYDDLCK